jgi:hypothetical protein
LAIAVLQHLQNWINDINDLVGQLKTKIPALANDLVVPPAIMSEATGLTTKTNNFGSTYSNNYAVPANGTSWPCMVKCAILGTAASTISTQITSEVIPVIEDYDSTSNTVRTEYKDKSDGATTQLRDAFDQLEKAQNGIIDQKTRDSVKDNSEMVEGYDSIRNSIFLALFSAVFLSPLLTAIGLGLKKGCPFKFTFCLGPFYMLIIFLLFGIHWFLGMAIGDTCYYLDREMLDAANALANRGGLANVVNACLTNTSLLVAMDLEDDFAFERVLQFPPVLTPAEVDQRFLPADQSVVQMVAVSQSLTPADFRFDEFGVIEGNTLKMNNTATNGVLVPPFIGYTRADVKRCETDRAGCFTARYSGQNLADILSYQDRAYQGLVVWNALSYDR